MRSSKCLTELGDNGEVVQDPYLTFPGHNKERRTQKRRWISKGSEHDSRGKFLEWIKDWSLVTDRMQGILVEDKRGEDVQRQQKHITLARNGYRKSIVTMGCVSGDD